jgi:hypothetical protein
MSIQSFVYNAQATRVIFGAGSVLQLGDEVWRLGCESGSGFVHSWAASPSRRNYWAIRITGCGNLRQGRHACACGNREGSPRICPACRR